MASIRAMQTSTATLIADRLGDDLPPWVHSRRADGKSWHRIAIELYELTGVLVTGETVRLWFRQDAA